MKITDGAAGRMAELVLKDHRQDKEDDVLMWVGTRTDALGEKVAQLRGAGGKSVFQKFKNAFFRQKADKENIKNLFMQRGMSPAQAEDAVGNVKKFGSHYSAKSVHDILTKFDTDQKQKIDKNPPMLQGKILSDEKTIGMGKTALEIQLGRISEGTYLEEYDPRTRTGLYP